MPFEKHRIPKSVEAVNFSYTSLTLRKTKLPALCGNIGGTVVSIA